MLFLYIFVSLLAITYLFYILSQSQDKKKAYVIAEEELNSYFCKTDLENERLVRKKWLISFFIFNAYSTMYSCSDAFSSNVFKTLLIEKGFFFAVLTAFSTNFILSFLITYYFAYKKRGTEWLLLTLFAIPGILLMEAYDLSKVQWDFPKSADPLTLKIMTLLFSLLILIHMSIYTYYFVNSLKLYNINWFRKNKISQAILEKYGSTT